MYPTIKTFGELLSSISQIKETFLTKLQFQKKSGKFLIIEVRKVILNMDEKKANLTGDIPAGILKGCVDSCISILTKILNTSIKRGKPF